MKMFLVIVILAGIVFFAIRHAAKYEETKAAAAAVATPTPVGTNYFKRPLDRTHEVINQVKKQRREDNY
ncbi:MAG: hypothetical protein WCH43_06565 [Verrucomicrobiota bacterium]